MSNPRDVLTANMPLVESAIAYACRHFRFTPEDGEDFASIVMSRLIDKDYAVVRAWEERSSFGTYIGAVVPRLALDYRIHAWGKWHASAEAKRLGALAVDLEQLLHRDRRTIDEVVALLAAKYGAVTRESLLALAARLPERPPPRREVDLDEAASIPASQNESPEERALDEERRTAAQRLSEILAAAIERLPDEDVLIMQLRFEQGMTVPQIARALQLDRRQLYYRLERCAAELRKELEHAGIAERDAADLIGRSEPLIRFDFVKRNPRPSSPDDETEAADSEDPQ